MHTFGVQVLMSHGYRGLVKRFLANIPGESGGGSLLQGPFGIKVRSAKVRFEVLAGDSVGACQP